MYSNGVERRWDMWFIQRRVRSFKYRCEKDVSKPKSTDLTMDILSCNIISVYSNIFQFIVYTLGIILSAVVRHVRAIGRKPLVYPKMLRDYLIMLTRTKRQSISFSLFWRPKIKSWRMLKWQIQKNWKSVLTAWNWLNPS